MLDPSADVMALIPVRGGSKGVPGKNVIELAGAPLLWWTVEAVRAAKSQMNLVVSTDSHSIAEYAKSLDATVILRPPELAMDTSPTEPTIAHALNDREQRHTTSVLLLQATSPLRLPGTIDRGISTFVGPDCDSVVSVVPEPPFLWKGDVENPRALYDYNDRRRRQDFRAEEQVFRETGSLYLFSAAGLLRTGNRLHGRIRLLILNPLEGIDIDTHYDLQQASCTLESEEWTVAKRDSDQGE